MLYPSIELAVSNYIDKTGDDNIELLKFSPQKLIAGYVADWHPTEATNIKAANKLVEKYKKFKGNRSA